MTVLKRSLTRKKSLPGSKEELEQRILSIERQEMLNVSSHAVSSAIGYIYRNTNTDNPVFRDYLYIESVLSRLPVVHDDDGKFIMCTDGKAIYYNPRELMRFKLAVEMEGGNSIATLSGILAHEALHILLGHTEKTGRGRSILRVVPGREPSPGEIVLANVRNVAMDKEVNRHVLRLVPDMFSGKAPAAGWNGIVLAPVDDGIYSFEDFYVSDIQDALSKICEEMGQTTPFWHSIHDGETLLVEKSNELRSLLDRRAGKKKSGGTQNNAMKRIQSLVGARPQEHDGPENRAHRIKENLVHQVAKNAYDQGNYLGNRQVNGGEETSSSSYVNDKGTSFNEKMKKRNETGGSLENHVRMYGRPGESGLISGSWNDMAKSVMATIIGKETVDDWTYRDPIVEIYESMGFGEMVVPGHKFLFTGSLMCVLDVSGSIGEDYFLGAWMEMASFASTLPPATQVSFVQVDTEIRHMVSGIVGDLSFLNMKEDVEKGTIARYGSGETLFAPFFKSVCEMDQKPDCIVFFTDMKVSDWDKMAEYNPGCPVLWVTTKEFFERNKDIDIIPFGSIYEMGELGIRMARENLTVIHKMIYGDENTGKSDTEISGNPSNKFLFDVPF